MSPDVGVDEKTGIIKRDSGENKMNPFDLYALETALQLKSSEGGRVHIMTMGPPMASDILKEGYMMGSDEGWLLTDRAFAGSDVLATSRTLAQGIRFAEKKEKFDLIICGKQTTDGDTAQVASECSEFLDIPCITNVIKTGIVVKNSIIVESDLGHKIERVKIPFPSIISVEKAIYQPRLPSYKLKKQIDDFIINTIALKDFSEQNPKDYGLDGSPTQVERIFSPEEKLEHDQFSGDSHFLSETLFEILINNKFLSEFV